MSTRSAEIEALLVEASANSNKLSSVDRVKALLHAYQALPGTKKVPDERLVELRDRLFQSRTVLFGTRSRVPYNDVSVPKSSRSRVNRGDMSNLAIPPSETTPRNRGHHGDMSVLTPLIPLTMEVHHVPSPKSAFNEVGNGASAGLKKLREVSACATTDNARSRIPRLVRGNRGNVDV